MWVKYCAANLGNENLPKVNFNMGLQPKKGKSHDLPFCVHRMSHWVFGVIAR